MSTKVLGIADIAVGIVAFAFEISFLATCKLCEGYTLAACGIWGGILFIITGVVAWKKEVDSSSKTLMMLMASISAACGVVLLGLTAAAINDFSFYSEYLATELGLESVLLVCGVCAIVINGLLLFLNVRG